MRQTTNIVEVKGAALSSNIVGLWYMIFELSMDTFF